jgi:hypothetical protein
MPMRSTGNNLLKVRARALTALMPPLRLRLSEWIEKISACPKACRHCPARWFRRHQTRTASTIFVSLDAGWRVGRSASPRNAVCTRLRTKIRAGAARRAELREIAVSGTTPLGDQSPFFATQPRTVKRSMGKGTKVSSRRKFGRISSSGTSYARSSGGLRQCSRSPTGSKSSACPSTPSALPRMELMLLHFPI